MLPTAQKGHRVLLLELYPTRWICDKAAVAVSSPRTSTYIPHSHFISHLRYVQWATDSVVK